MSKISSCPRCGGNIVEPAYPGDGAYPVGRMCECANGYEPPAKQYERERRDRARDEQADGEP